MKGIYTQISDELHALIKREAMIRGMYVKAFIIESLEKNVKKAKINDDRPRKRKNS